MIQLVGANRTYRKKKWRDKITSVKLKDMRLYLSTPVSNPLTVTERVKWIKLQIITKEQMRHDKLFSQAEERLTT